MQPTSSRQRTLRAAAILASTTIALLGFGALPASAAPGDVAIDVYTMNDFHGRIETTPTTAGAAVIAGAYKGFKAANPNSTLVSAGDNVGASTFTSFVQDDNPTIDALNATGLTVSTIGNHELDHGTDDLDNHIIPRADFELISANLFTKGTTEHAYAPYDIQTFEGVRVGFIGAVTEALPSLVSPAGIATLDVAPIVTSVNNVASELSDGDETNGEADVLMLVIHEGAATSTADVTDQSTAFGKIVMGTGPNLDAIVSGHTHVAYSYNVPFGDRIVPVLQTGSYGTNLGHIALTVDPTLKTLTSINGSLIPLLNGTVPAFPADPTVQAIVDAAVVQSNLQGQVKVGSTTSAISRALQEDGSENRGGESPLLNLIADAQIAATADSNLESPIAFMNPGGARADLPAGDVTYKAAATVQSFANTLVTAQTTGAQIKAVLEQQWQPAGAQRPFLKLGISADLAYIYDPAAAVGSHITQIFYQGAPITDDQVFTVVMNSFLAAGGDNFTELANTQNQADSGRVDLQAFVDYIEANSPVAPDSATRSVGVTDLSASAVAGAVDLGTATPGTEYSFALSSLILSSAPVKDSEVVVLFDGVELSRADIDPTIISTTDEQGRATVSFAIPASVTNGAHEVSFRLADTGIELTFPVQVTGGIGPVVEEPSTQPSIGGGDGAVTPAAQAALAATGLDATVPLLGAGLLLALGTLVLLRRRRVSQVG